MKLLHNTTLRVATLRCAFVCLPIAGLHAAENAASLPELEPTLVTGDLWETPLERISASVTIVDAEALTPGASLRFEDVLPAIPNLTFTGGTSRARYFQIRGIGESSQFEGHTPDSSVRFLVDDFDFTGLGGVATLFDVSQVEVLRGPQAGAFGANASGGVIRVVTNPPTPYWTGHIEGTLGSDDLRAGGFALGGPLIEADPERLMARVAVERLTSNGFRRNEFINRRDTNQRDELLARLRLTWNPSDQWTWDAAFLYGDQNNGYDEFTLRNTGFRTESDEPGEDAQKSYAASLRGQWHGGDHFTVTSVTGFTDTDSLYSFDGDWTAPGNATATGYGPGLPYNDFFTIDRSRLTGSQEIRLDSLDNRSADSRLDRWTLGFYTHVLRENTGIDYRDVFGGFAADSRFEARTYSVFGQAGIAVAPNTRIIGGLRYEYYDVRIRANPAFEDETRFNSNRENLVGGKLTLEHDLNEDHLLFTSLTRGYRGGGANIEIISAATTQALTFESERIWNLEAGWRGAFLENRIRPRVTAFYTQRRNAQVRESAGAGSAFSFFTVNDDEIEHYGAEAEVQWQLAERWTLDTALGLLQTRRTDFIVQSPDGSRGTIPLSSRDLANSPPVTYAATLRYDDGSRYFGSFGLRGRSSQYESNSHNEKRDAFTVFDANAGVRVGDWTLNLWAKNLFDARYQKRIFFFANEAPSFDTDRRYESPADPRTFGVTARYDF